MYRFGKFLAPTPDVLRTLSRALLLSISCFLQGLASNRDHSQSQQTGHEMAHEMAHEMGQETEQNTAHSTEEPILTMDDCLRLISTCREVMKKAQDDSMEGANRLLYQLEFYALVHSHSPTIESKLVEITQTVAVPYTFYLDIFYLLQQESSPEHKIMKECLRNALQVLLKEPSIAMTAVLEVFHCMMDVCDTKAEVYHWAEQLLQITRSQGESVTLSDES